MTGTRRHLILLLLLLFPGRVFAQTVPPDVEGYWAEGRIRELITRQIVEVFPDGTFRPQETLSRARFVAWLGAVKGLPLLRAAPPGSPDGPRSPPLRAKMEPPTPPAALPPMAQFRPAEPLTRSDAIHWTVRALGHTFESAYMANAALPFEDPTGVAATRRGI